MVEEHITSIFRLEVLYIQCVPLLPSVQNIVMQGCLNEECRNESCRFLVWSGGLTYYVSCLYLSFHFFHMDNLECFFLIFFYF
jgi:hypothetical protein